MLSGVADKVHYAALCLFEAHSVCELTTRSPSARC